MSPSAILALALVVASVQPGAPAPPPIVRMAPVDRPALRLASFHPGEVRCGGVVRRAIRSQIPLPTAVALGEDMSPPAIGLRFRIDTHGRPLSIRPDGARVHPRLDVRDLQPALAAWRFEPGAAAAECAVDFAVRLDSVASADLGLLYRYAALNRMQMPGPGGALVRAAFERLTPAGSNCVRPPPRELERRDPDYQSIPEVPGGISYSFYGFDIDAAGRPAHIRLLSSSGNRELDLRGDFAVGSARYAPAARHGCTYYYFRYSTEVVKPPPAPAPRDFRPADSDCPDRAHLPPEQTARLQFPMEFSRRAAEGWAILVYDIAANGEVRAPRIAASEPAAAFGEQVLNALEGANVGKPPRAFRGCVARIRFDLPGG